MDLDELLEELENTKNMSNWENQPQYHKHTSIVAGANKSSHQVVQRSTLGNNIMNIQDVLDLDELTPVGIKAGEYQMINGRSRALASNLNEDSWEADILDALKENNS